MLLPPLPPPLPHPSCSSPSCSCLFYHCFLLPFPFCFSFISVFILFLYCIFLREKKYRTHTHNGRTRYKNTKCTLNYDAISPPPPLQISHQFIAILTQGNNRLGWLLQKKQQKITKEKQKMVNETSNNNNNNNKEYVPHLYHYQCRNGCTQDATIKKQTQTEKPCLCCVPFLLCVHHRAVSFAFAEHRHSRKRWRNGKSAKKGICVVLEEPLVAEGFPYPSPPPPLIPPPLSQNLQERTLPSPFLLSPSPPFLPTQSFVCLQRSLTRF